MKSVSAKLGVAALIGFLLVLPFAILELSFQTVTPRNAPGLIVLFGLMWLLPTVFTVVLVPLVRTMRAGQSVMANPLGLVFRVAFLTLVAMMWAGIVIDQLPCFLGIPNCD